MATKPIDPDFEKQQAICVAAAGVFSRYGFRRSSMEDIARAAGMSRPALYLHFKNKEDIFRTMTRLYYADAEIALDEALSQPGPIEQVLRNALKATTGPAIEELLDSPHGAELLGAAGSVSEEINREGQAALSTRLAQWLEAQAEQGAVSLVLPANDTARAFMAALKGIKEPPAAQYAANRDRMAALFAKALKP